MALIILLSHIRKYTWTHLIYLLSKCIYVSIINVIFAIEALTRIGALINKTTLRGEYVLLERRCLLEEGRNLILSLRQSFTSVFLAL